MGLFCDDTMVINVDFNTKTHDANWERVAEFARKKKPIFINRKYYESTMWAMATFVSEEQVNYVDAAQNENYILFPDGTVKK